MKPLSFTHLWTQCYVETMWEGKWMGTATCLNHLFVVNLRRKANKYHSTFYCELNPMAPLQTWSACVLWYSVIFVCSCELTLFSTTKVCGFRINVTMKEDIINLVPEPRYSKTSVFEIFSWAIHWYSMCCISSPVLKSRNSWHTAPSILFPILGVISKINVYD